MKKLINILCIVSSLCTCYLHAEIGCMDKSHHTKELFDAKVYHYVQCNCPCWKYKKVGRRNKCIQCGHYHEAKRFEIIGFENRKNRRMTLFKKRSNNGKKTHSTRNPVTS